MLKVQHCAFNISDSTTIPLTVQNWQITSFVPDSTDFVVDSSYKCIAVRTVGMQRCPGFHKNVSFSKWTNQIAEIINFLDSTTLCLTRYAASLLQLNSSGRLNKHNIMHYFSYINSKWFRQTDKRTNIIQNIRTFRSLVLVLNKLPDHHNLSFFNDMLQFWYQSWVSLFVLWHFSCHQNKFHWYELALI